MLVVDPVPSYWAGHPCLAPPFTGSNPTIVCPVKGHTQLFQYTEDHPLVKGILVAASPSDEFSRPICSIIFCMICLGFLFTFSAQEHELVKVSWRLWDELERAQALESLKRVTPGGSFTIFELQFPDSPALSHDC